MEKKFTPVRKLLTGVLLALSFTANATTYYFSAAGNDANNGTSTSTSWKTVSKFNSVFASKSPGDNFLFNRGDIFYGNLVISRSGSSGNPITIGAYGTGANPVITGLTTVSAWSSLGSNIWESTSAIATSSPVSMVIINGVNTPMGRYPNTGYITYQSFSGKTSITSSSLTGTPNWTGAEAVIRKQRWIIDRNPITAQSGGTLTYKASSTYDGQAGYGFFIQNDSRTLDVQNEWYYNPSTKKLRIYSASTPANVQVTTKDTLVALKYRGYITFDNISFQGSNKDAFVILSSNNVTIQNCAIDYSGSDAIWGNQNWGQPSSSFVLKNSMINHTNNNAIFLADEFAGALISHNTFKNTGMIVGMSGSGDAMASAIQTKANNVIVEYNEVDSVGYVGIGFYDNNTIVRNNLVNGFNFVKLDGAGIYTWVGTGNSPFTGQKVLNNIVMNGFGDNAGTTATGNPISHGIYADDWTANIEIAGNSVANCPHSGIYIHKAYNLNVHNNTSFNNGQYQLLMVSSDQGSLIRNDIVKNNIFFSKASTQLVGGFQSVIDDIKSFGTIDSNYYTRPISESAIFNVTINNYATYYNYTLAQWQAYAGFDAHSKKAPKTVTTVNDLRFEYNASSANKTITLDGNYIDVKNVSYNGSITLAPYTSAVLIRNGAATNNSPTANAGTDQTITLPTNSVSLSGSGTDIDGSITAYGWAKVSGPTLGTITSATSAATTVTAMVQGVYKFQLKVTDNAGATGFDTIQVTVNAAGNTPPTANAGADQTITLPTSTASLSGSGADPGGSISAYLWTKVSGPASGAITSATSAATTVTALAQGVYKFQLKVTDNGGATGFDTIQVTVNAAGNTPPTANAGANQIITLPTSTVSLSGSGADPGGSISAYLWTKVSGPASGTITSATSAATTVTALAQGVYKFQLKVTDNGGATGFDTIQVTVNAAGNTPPTANAGTDQTITLPTSTASLSGSGTDPGGSISAYLWTKVSGPASGTITSATAAATTVTALAQGVYKFQLKVTDNAGATGFDTMQVTVNPAGNGLPTANAGPDQTITLPASTINLSGSGTDPGGSISAYRWTKVSGPTSGTITSSTSAATTVTALVQGVYKFRLRVTDNSGNRVSDTVQVTVNAAGGTLLPAVNPANTVNGLDYKYYETTAGWNYMPIFSTLTPVKTGAATGFTISLANRTTRFAFYFTGFVSVPADGQYTFYTTSDEGSYLAIDGMVVVNNDGLHTSTEKSGTIGLKAGKHAIAVGYFQQDGSSVLTVEYSSPALTRRVIPASALYRISTAGLSLNNNANQAISSITQVGVKVYPNPFIGHIDINITGGLAGAYKLMLVDVSGRVLWTRSGVKNAGAFQQSVNTSALERGTYFIKLIQNNTNSVITLVK